MKLKAKITALRRKITDIDVMKQNKGHFIAAIQWFMEMKSLIAPLLRELIECFDVYCDRGRRKESHSIKHDPLPFCGIY